MLKLAVAVLIASAPAASSFTIPDFASYDPEADLLPYLAICAADMERMAAGGRESIVDEVAASIPPAEANRLRDVCISFFLGAHFVTFLRDRASPAVAI